MKILLLLIPFFCLSNTKIRCKIVDENNTAIPFVNIHIKNTTVGTVSNGQGFFEINISKKHMNKVIILSSIGFKTKEISIEKALHSKVIQLETRLVLLEEVSIGKRPTAEALVKKAFDNYYKKFPTEPFVANGFLRHSERTKTDYKWLIESAIQLYDPGYDKPSKEVKTAILEIRKSFDNRKLDTLNLYKFYLGEAKGMSFRKAWKKNIQLSEISKKEIQNAIIFNDNRSSSPSHIFSKAPNRIRYYNQKNAVLDKKILKKHNFKIDTILSYNDNEDVYKIKINPKNPPAKLSKHHGKYLLPLGWIYIRANDYAILELEYILINSKKATIFTEITGSKINSRFKIKFTAINGKMYPKYMSYERPKTMNRFKSIMDSLVIKKTIKSKDHYFSKQEIVFTEIITDKELVNKQLTNKIWNDDFFSPRDYNAVFWENTTILLESEEQQKMIQDLEKKISLKKQYHQN